MYPWLTKMLEQTQLNTQCPVFPLSFSFCLFMEETKDAAVDKTLLSFFYFTVVICMYFERKEFTVLGAESVFIKWIIVPKRQGSKQEFIEIVYTVKWWKVCHVYQVNPL